MKYCRFGIPMLLGAILLALCVGAAHSAVRYVRPTGNDLNNGATWAQAKKSVQAAIDAANNGDEVWVAAGIYNEKITIKNGVEVFGGFNGTESVQIQRNWIANVTTLNGQDQSGKAVVTIRDETESTLDGFTVTRGGNGAVYIGVGASAVIRNNTITDNSASLGAGIYCADESSPEISENIIQSNRAMAGRGGGVYCINSAAAVHNNIVRGNAAYNGGGIYTLTLPPSPEEVVEHFPTITNNIVADNTATLYGGGILVKNASNIIANNTVVRNTAGIEGGGFFVERAADIAESEALSIGNNIVAFNGSGIYVSGDAEALWIVNNCVYANIFYDFAPELPVLEDLFPEGDFSGNFFLDPMFVDFAADNYRIVYGSPCRDAGANWLVAEGDKDIDGRPRIYPEGGTVDVGVHEWEGSHTVYYVSPSGSNSSDGSEWRFAKRTIQAALDTSLPGDEVWVAAGTYNENITPKESVRIYGGFAGVEESASHRNPAANVTTIQGSGGTVVVLRSLSILDGFTIKGGQIGVQCTSVNSSIASCIVTGNAVGIQAAGSYLDVTDCSLISNTAIGISYSQTQGTIAGCVFTNNGGTGLLCSDSSSPTVYSAQFVGNAAYGVRLEGSSNPSIFDSTISGSQTGVYCYNGSAPFLRNSIISQNAYYGMQCNQNASPSVEECWISDNTRTGVYVRNASNPILRNTVLVRNGGDAVACEDSSPTITNCTIVRNGRRGIWTHNSSPAVTNVIIAGNKAAAGSAVDNTGSGSPAISHCCFYANGAAPFKGLASPVGKNGNIGGNPKFVDSITGSYALVENSPCLAAGNPSAPWAPTEDMDGTPRPFGAISIGAYELYSGSVPEPRVIYAASNAPAGGNGTSWANAYVDIQKAINDAAATGGQVWVRAGNYYGRIILKEGTEVYGGFTGTETSLEQRNPLSNQTSIVAPSTVAAVTGENWSAVDGFNLRGGLYGVYCGDKSPDIANCVIQQNSTGTYLSSGAYVDITNCTFDANVYYGIYCHTDSYANITDCTITNNAGGIYCFASSPAIKSCLIQNNRTYGILMDTGSLATVEDCELLSNSTGIYCYNKSAPNISGTEIYFSTWYGLRCDAQSSPKVVGCSINRNIRLGVYCYSQSNAALLSCTISANGTDGVLADYASPSLVNCTIAGNGGSGIFSHYAAPSLVNGIIAFNGAEQGGAIKKQGSGTPSISYTCFYSNGGNPYLGMPASPIGVDSNIEANPRFAAAGLGNYNLLADSPCIDSGKNVAGLPALDAAGNSRIVNDVVDRGSLERQ